MAFLVHLLKLLGRQLDLVGRLKVELGGLLEVEVELGVGSAQRECLVTEGFLSEPQLG